VLAEFLEVETGKGTDALGHSDLALGGASGTISGFHLGEAIDLRGLAFSSSSSTLTWKQTTSGANASGTLTVRVPRRSPWSAATRRQISAQPRTATAAH
jgi:hypothetical protein